MVAELFVTGDREFQTAGAMILNALENLRLQVADGNEAGHIDKPVVTFKIKDKIQKTDVHEPNR